MEPSSADEGIHYLQELTALEDRHKSLSFEEARRGVFTDESNGWRIFVEKYSCFVYSVALRLLSGPGNEVQEQAQEIYSRVFSMICRDNYRVLRQFQSRCEFTTYLFRMVQTARSTTVRREGRDLERTDYVDFSDEANRGIEAQAAEQEDQPDVLPSFSPDRLREEIARALDGLSPPDKLLIKLRFQKGLKLREIAENLDFRDTNDAAYALRKALRHFEPLAALEAGEWTEQETALVLDVLNEQLFQ